MTLLPVPGAPADRPLRLSDEIDGLLAELTEHPIRLRDLIGVDQLMWGSDYPHAESTWPKSQQILERILADVPEDEKAKIASANVARLYQFN